MSTPLAATAAELPVNNIADDGVCCRCPSSACSHIAAALSSSFEGGRDLRLSIECVRGMVACSRLVTVRAAGGRNEFRRVVDLKFAVSNFCALCIFVQEG